MSKNDDIRLDTIIPDNYDNFGKLFGGFIEIRNFVEAICLCIPIYFIEKLIFFNSNMKIFLILFSLTVIPLAIACITGINGDSFLQFVGYMIHYYRDKKEYRYKRIQAVTSEHKGRSSKNKKVKLKKK